MVPVNVPVMVNVCVCVLSSGVESLCFFITRSLTSVVIVSR